MKEKISKEQFCNNYGELKDSLYRYALYRMGNSGDAEDAVSDAVLAAWQSRDKLQDIEAFGAWIFAILRNTCSSKIKSLIRQREKLEKAMISEKINSGSALCNEASLSVEILEALEILSDEDKDIVLMSVIGEFTSKEISEITGLKAGSVRSRLSRSLARMRDYLS